MFGKASFFRFPPRCFQDAILIQVELLSTWIQSVPDLLESLIEGVIRCAGKEELNPVPQDEHAAPFDRHFVRLI